MVLDPLIIGLLLLAALMHASWNAVLKSDQSDRLVTFGVITAMGVVLGLCAMPFLPSIEPAAWKYVIVSVPIHILYFTFLLRAYSYGDLSHIYPIARGLSPLLVMLVSGSLIGEHLRVQDVVGILLMSGGVIALALSQRSVAPASAGPTLQHRLAYIAWLYVLDGPWLLLLAIWLRPAKVWSHLRTNWWRGLVG